MNKSKIKNLLKVLFPKMKCSVLVKGTSTQFVFGDEGVIIESKDVDLSSYLNSILKIENLQENYVIEHKYSVKKKGLAEVNFNQLSLIMNLISLIEINGKIKINENKPVKLEGEKVSIYFVNNF